MLGSYDLVKKLNSSNSRYFLFSLLFVLAIVFCSDLWAASLIKKVDGIEVNWSSSRFRSSGEASIDTFSTAGIASSDTKAWNNGLISIGEDAKKLASVLIPGEVSEEDLVKLEKSVRSSSYTVNTEYYGTKGIRVIVENRISKIYKSSMSLGFLPKDQGGAGSKNTGIIFQISSHVEPSGVYNLYDGAGNVVFSSSSVYEDAFDYYTMGRWFNSSSKSDIAKVVGDNPVVVRVDVKDGRMVVSDIDTWNLIVKENRGLLANAKIAMVVD